MGGVVLSGDAGIKLAMINKLESKLASFAESDYVKDLLTQMLKDLALREEVLESALESTKKEYEEHKEKLRKYEIEGKPGRVHLHAATDCTKWGSRRRAP